MVAIKNLINTDSVWVAYPAVEDESFEFELKFATKDKIQKMQKAATTMKWRKNQQVEEYSDDKFMEAFIKACVVNWRGLTVEKLQDMIPVDLSDISEEELSESVEFSVEQLLDLIDNDTTNLAEWLVTQSRNIENFTKSNSANVSE